MQDPNDQVPPAPWHDPVLEPYGDGPAPRPDDADARTVPVQAVRTDTGRSIRLGILAGVAAIVVAGIAVTMAAAPSAAPVTGETGLTAAASATPAASTPADPNDGGPGRGGRGMRGFGGPMMGGPGMGGPGMGGPGMGDPGWSFGGRGGGMRGHPFGAITIAEINGSSLSLKTDDGWTRTIAVTDATKLSRAGATITVADLKVGDTIRFSETRNSDGTYTIDQVVVVVPVVSGGVTDVTADGFTLKDRDGLAHKVSVSSSTTFALGGSDGTRADLKVGADVIVAGPNASDGSITALSVQIQVPQVQGTVSDATASGFTISRRDGTTLVVHVSSKTTYQVAGKAAAALSDITNGTVVMVAGTQRADGSLDALSVVAGHLGGRGRGPGMWGGPDASPSPSATPTTNG